MRVRRLKDFEQDFVNLNPEIIEIKYYPRPAKSHRTEPSIFRIRKGYAFLLSKKLIKHFRKCEIISVTELRPDKDVVFESISECLLGKK